MNVTYSPKTEQGTDGVLLQRATKLLEEVLGPSAEPVSAHWEQKQDEQGRNSYVLTIRDSTGELSACFAPGELRSPARVRSRLRDLWGDFLQAESNARVKKLLQLMQTMHEGE